MTVKKWIRYSTVSPAHRGARPFVHLTYLVRSGASTDGVNWTYSDPVAVTVIDCITTHTVNTQAIPKPGLEKWFRPSNVISKSFQVLHTNPYP